MTDKGEQLNFAGLVEAIRQVHEHCASQAGKAINVSLTLRNWVIGYYILEYEQRGADRADFGLPVPEIRDSATPEFVLAGSYVPELPEFAARFGSIPEVAGGVRSA